MHSESENCSIVSDSETPCYTVHGLLQGRNWSGVDSRSLLQGNLSSPGIEPRSPTMQADSLPAEPPGKHKKKYNHISKLFKFQFFLMLIFRFTLVKKFRNF